jgi:hypothetical protein
VPDVSLMYEYSLATLPTFYTGWSASAPSLSSTPSWSGPDAHATQPCYNRVHATLTPYY